MIALVQPSTDQRALIERARAGDRQALEDLARQVWPLVRTWALIELGDPILAEDAAQESLIVMVRFLNKYDVDRTFKPWLRTLVRNQAKSQGRKRKNLPDQRVPLTAAASVDVDRALDLDAGAQRALDAFCGLTPNQRRMIELVDRQDLAPAEAAIELNIPQGTARSLLHGARKALRMHLIKHAPELLALVKEAP